MSLSSAQDNKNTGSLPEKIVSGLTTEKLLEEFRTLQERWEGTSLARQVEGLIGEREWCVEQAVCVGIGSFSRDWAHRWRSLWQLVLFVAVRELLLLQNQQKNEEKMEISSFAQDPAFTALDEAFLRALDIDVLEEGLQGRIGKQTFVFSPFVDWFLLLPRFLKGREPVLYVGNEILDDYTPYAQTKEKIEALEECNAIGKKWVEGREVVKLGEFEKHGNALNGLVVYWRKEVDEEEVKEEKKAEEQKTGEEQKEEEQTDGEEKEVKKE
jgi:hypothetical protein